jgi:alpha,alpha-trehalase
VSRQPISSYALLSDRHSAALVGQGGSIDWLCFPRFDSPSVFGSMLDPAAGHWSVRPRANWTSRRAYIDRTMVLTTIYRTATGTVEVTDALATGGSDDPHRLGEGAPHLFIRAVTGREGEVAMHTEWCPRPEYGLVTPLLSPQADGVLARGGPAWLALSSPIRLTVDTARADVEFTVSAGQRLLFGLQWAPLADDPARFRSQTDLADQLEATVAAWTAWSVAHRSYTGVHAEQVWISGRVLQALSYQPTGAVIAAPTTSLPEALGGIRNWDYRYAWIRDAAFSMDAVRIAACPDEAGAFFDFMTTAAANRQGDAPLQIMYGVSGERELYERELTHLAGWRGSVPVRIGDGAFDQDQLDVYGELLETAAHFRDQLADADDAVKTFLRSLADTAADRWAEPDRGIWEIRGEPRHFLYSKLMCWVALDRAVGMADLLDAADRADAWTTERDKRARQRDEAAHRSTAP